jgi:putative endonuclease
MYYVYILKSIKTNQYYIGYTNDLKKRLSDHNSLKNKATKANAPWELVYYEAYKNRKAATEREKKLKKYGQGLRRLKERIDF